MKITGVSEVGGMTVTNGKLILENGSIAAMHVNGLVNNNLTELSVTTGNTINWDNSESTWNRHIHQNRRGRPEHHLVQQFPATRRP
ncbi:MAG: hypothetical protein U1F87_10825 [Kiritimatiellia bacterium]